MKVIILAGGKGTRLWLMSREKYSKQFFVSAIVPYGNEAGLIEKCLDYIIANDYPEDKLEVFCK